MLRSYRHYIITVFGCIVAATLVGWLLQPKQPSLLDDRGYQEQRVEYRAGGADCEPAALARLPSVKRARKAGACEEIKEQHRQAANSLIEARRSADAADASAVAAVKQAAISGWEAALGLVTMLAAIAAALFAERAAFHTKRSADAAEDALEQSERPHLLLTEVKIDGLKREPLSEGLAITHKFINYGNGPAWMQKSGIAMAFHPTGWPPTFGDDTVELTDTRWSVAPKDWYGSFNPSNINVPVDRQADVISGVLSLYILIWIVYVDAGQRRHEHRIAMIYEPANDRLVPFDSPFWRYS